MIRHFCWCLFSKYLDRFDGVRVKDPRYGAQGNGVTIDTDAIQKAQDAATAAGTYVWFDKGTYVSGPIKVNPGEVIDWRGPGRDQVTIKLKDNPCGSLLERDSSGSVTINFEGLTFDGNKGGAGIDYSTRLVYFWDCAGATVRNCTFQNYAGHAFFPAAVSCTGDITALNTRWIDADWHSGKLNKYAGSFGVITQGQAQSDKEIWIRVHGCTFEQTDPCPGPGLGPQGVFIEWDKTNDSAGVMVSIDNNVFRRIGQNHAGNHAGPVKIYRGAKHIHITNNKFYDSSHRAIALHRCEFLRVEGNTIDGFTSPNPDDAGTGAITMVERMLGDGGHFLKSKHIVSNNIIRGLDPATDLGGITWQDESVGAELSEIHFHHNIIDGGRYGIAVFTANGEITIDHNTIRNINDHVDIPKNNNGILVRHLRNGARIQIDHNLITWDPTASNRNSGILVTSGNSDSSTGIHAFVNDNKIYNADKASIIVTGCEFASIENNKVFDQGPTVAHSIAVADNGTEIISNNYDNQGKTILSDPVASVMSEQFNNFGFFEQPGIVSWGSAAPEGVVDGYYGKVYIEVGSRRRVWQKDSNDGTLTGWVLVGSQT